MARLLVYVLQGDIKLQFSQIYYNQQHCYISKTTTTMKFSVFAIAALATATSSRCIVSATAIAANTAARKRKVTKKGGSLSVSYGVTGPPTPECFSVWEGATVPCIDCTLMKNGTLTTGDHCVPNLTTGDCCAIPPGLEHGVYRPNVISIAFSQPSVYRNGQSGSSCGDTTDCVVPPGLDHAVCRHNQCQR